MVGFYR